MTTSLIAAEIYDAAIVGAGPAGAVAATLFARRGLRVVLIEKQKWPREKPCGGCLNAAAVRMLQQSNLCSALQNSLPLSRLQVHLAGSPKPLAIPTPHGRVIARQIFDAHLVESAIAAGCHFLPSTTARLLAADSAKPYRQLQLTHAGITSTINARLVLACDGLNGPLLQHEPWARWLALPNSRIGIAFTVESPAPIPAESITMCIAPAGYVGLVRQSHSRIHIGASLDPTASNHFRSPTRLIQNILNACNLQMPNIIEAPFQGTRPLSGHRANLGGYRVLALGDACGYVEPFTGEGISWAIRSALALSKIIPTRLENWPAELPRQWQALYHHEIARRQIWCRTLRNILRQPALTALCLNAARFAPAVPSFIAHRISA